MKNLLLPVIPFLLTVFSPWVFASELSWLTPSDIHFRNHPVSDRMIPLGFSKKGVFSYILQENSCQEPLGDKQKLSWIAVSLITDKVLELVNLRAELPDVKAEEVMIKHRKTIEGYNSKYGIIASDTYSIVTNTTVQSKNDALTIQTELIEQIDGEDAVNPGYRKYKISLSSKTKGIKTLGNLKSVYEPLQFWGYVNSPFEERVAALFISDFRGCGAFPQMRINIIGANLVIGFKPKKGK